jgi:signal recognition particle receptor subunit beta
LYDVVEKVPVVIAVNKTDLEQYAISYEDVLNKFSKYNFPIVFVNTRMCENVDETFYYLVNSFLNRLKG